MVAAAASPMGRGDGTSTSFNAKEAKEAKEMPSGPAAFSFASFASFALKQWGLTRPKPPCGVDHAPDPELQFLLVEIDQQPDSSVGEPEV